ncbi:MAG: 23S rRNA (uracil(1939)-C(5))-methyltransferase RlmD [Schleiferilactobacillus perolens]|uniref:RNA methyltransferase n=1 Tax=Schleiferilactobacillus perolens DSM 12744 TaxID=1423792 RepID=A0A0R1N6X0_9LACO|nr:23S rRNA (uracil(1939)-C(5))-methyltransferase RlmD [Schleiferilactobacillus perolens]KRL13362.1 RNA methyltransferase [Schleiferilactobacillus perolens DSM 12744]
MSRYSRTTAPVDVSVGERVIITIKRLGINGEGIGYFRHKIIFIPGVLPGEVASVTVTEVAPKFLRGVMTHIEKPSRDRVQPTDPNYGKVGGVELNHMAYAAQVAFKDDVLRQSLEKFAPRDYKDYKIKPGIGMTNHTHYRHKAQFPLAVKNGRIIAGMYAPGTHDLVSITDSITQTKRTMQAINQLVKILNAIDAPIYDFKRHQEGLRTLVVRESASTDDLQVTLISSQENFHGRDLLRDAIRRTMPQVTSLMENVNFQDTSLLWGPNTIHLSGESTITEKLRGNKYVLSPEAFFQLNPVQTEQLYNIALRALALSKDDKLIDAYAGVGTLGLSAARHVAEVRGMEVIPAAVRDAQHNAEINGITNAHYTVGKAEAVIPRWHKEGFIPTALIVDPPRTGLDIALRKTIIQEKPAKFVYISCNPSTLARDLVTLTEAYDVDWLQSIDMFPETARCECIVKLSLRK